MCQQKESQWTYSLSPFCFSWRAYSLGNISSPYREYWKRTAAMLLSLHWRLFQRPLPKSLGLCLGHPNGPGQKTSGLPGSIGSWFPCSEWRRDQTLGGPLVGAPGGPPSRGFPPAGTGSLSWSSPSRHSQRLGSHPGSGGGRPWTRPTWPGPSCFRLTSACTTASGSWSGPRGRTQQREFG